MCRHQEEALLIIDSTFTRRTGKLVGNRYKFRHGGPYIEGHQFTNFILLINDQPIPLCSVPFYSKEYCKLNALDYQTEIEMVSDWIETLPAIFYMRCLPGPDTHLLDPTSGYFQRPYQHKFPGHYSEDPPPRNCYHSHLRGLANGYRPENHMTQ
jgi:hypothetical protein